jgi:F-type H+-transporting ATPase subunit delta
VNRDNSSARRYAEALFELARDKGTLDSWATELGRLAELGNDPVAARLLATPGGDTSGKRRAIEAIAGPLSPEVGRLVDLLLERKRGHLFPALGEAFADRVREHRGILRADVTTAVPLNDADRDMVAARLRRHFGKEIEVHNQVDAQILGGVVARVGDQLLDGSLRGSLERLRQRLTNVSA